jgi:hypothetical protein
MEQRERPLSAWERWWASLRYPVSGAVWERQVRADMEEFRAVQRMRQRRSA